MKPETVSPLVLVAMPSGEFLALSQDAFADARELGRRVAGNTPAAANDAPVEPLLTAEQMEERTGVPASWFLEQARKGTLPHVRLGKYVRFRFSELSEACDRRRK